MISSSTVRRIDRINRIVAGLNGTIESFIFADLMASIVLSVLAFGTVEPWSVAVFELNALLLLVLMALRWTISGEGDWRILRLALPLLALLLLAVVQVIRFGSTVAASDPEIPAINLIGAETLSLDPHATCESAIKLLALTIYFAAALRVLRHPGRRRLTLIGLTVFGFAVSIFAVVQRLTYNGKMYWFRPVSPYIAPYGPYGNYNHFAGMIELIWPLPFAYLLFSRIEIEERLIWLFSVVIMIVAAVFSLSRGGMLTIGVQSLAFMAFIRLSRRGRENDDEPRAIRTNKLLIASSLLAILALTLWIGYDPLVDRFGTIREGRQEFSVATRTEYWRASWRMFLDHPWAGVGLGAFPAIYPSYGRSSARYERLEQAHNDYLQLLTDAGLIGGLTGLWFLSMIFRAARGQGRRLDNLRGRDRALIVGGYISIIGMLVHSFFDFNLQITANALLSLFAVALATSTDVTKERLNP